MPSEVPSDTNASIQTQPLPHSAAAMKPSAREVASTLQDAADPLAFVQQNLAALRNQHPTDQINPSSLSREVEERRAKEEAAVKPQGDTSTDSKADIPLPDINLTGEKKDGQQQENGEGEQKQEVQGDGNKDGEENEGELQEVKSPSAENFKNLRNIVKTVKHQLTEKETELNTVKSELEQYKSGEVLPEILQSKEQRISELERYEKIVSLKTSPAYHDKYIRPLSEINDRLSQIAKDYEIPTSVMSQALSLDNRAELNRFLSSHFDDVGALEVKQLVEKARGIQTEAREAEKEPTSALERIVAEAENARAEKRKKDLQVMSQASKDAWVDSLIKIREEGDAIELIHKPGDSAYNQKFVDPIVRTAAQEYGKLVTMLAEHGLERLPKDLAFALSRMCQLAHASSVAMATRNEALRHSEELSRNVERESRYDRPALGSSGGHAGSPGPMKLPESPKQAAEMLLEKVMGQQK